jgi:hypothetical protein
MKERRAYKGKTIEAQSIELRDGKGWDSSFFVEESDNGTVLATQFSLTNVFQTAEAAIHFKLATAILMISMALLASFGIVIPLRHAAQANPTLFTSYHGVLLAFLALFGYMLTELGHYRIYQPPKYTTLSEKVFFTLTVLVVIGLAAKWWLFR